MPIGLVFWFLYACWLVIRFFGWRGVWSSPGPNGPWFIVGADAFTMALIFLLGWHEFGFIIRYS
jgi:hypothetical protein